MFPSEPSNTNWILDMIFYFIANINVFSSNCSETVRLSFRSPITIKLYIYANTNN